VNHIGCCRGELSVLIGVFETKRTFGFEKKVQNDRFPLMVLQLKLGLSRAEYFNPSVIDAVQSRSCATHSGLMR
jgi:hypothetical protein